MPKATLPQLQPVFTPGSQQTALMLLEKILEQSHAHSVKMDKALARLPNSKSLRSRSRRGQEKLALLVEELRTAMHVERANLLTESRKAPRTNMHWLDMYGIITSPYQKRLATEK